MPDSSLSLRTMSVLEATTRDFGPKSMLSDERSPEPDALLGASTPMGL